MAHNQNVTYEKEFLRGVHLTGWTVQEDGSGEITVSGPCPVCDGDAYGPSLPMAEATEDATLLHFDRPPEIVARILAACRCGTSHGRDGASSCGRSWIVVVKRDQQ